MTYDLVAKVLNILLRKSQTVVFLVAVPLLKLDHQIHRLSIFNAFYTKQRFYINNADTPKLYKMPCDIRCGTNQSDVADLTKLHHIITDKTVASFDQLQSSLTFPDSALSRDQGPNSKMLLLASSTSPGAVESPRLTRL